MSFQLSMQLKAQIRDCILRFEPATFACKRPPNVEGSIGFLEDVDEGMGNKCYCSKAIYSIDHYQDDFYTGTI